MYYRARESVLQALKKQARAVQGLDEDAFYEGSAQGGLRGTFTLKNTADNLFVLPTRVHMEQLAAGKSVLGELGYLGSSYAMLYNLLGNEHASIDNRPYMISYKRMLRALKMKNAFVTIDAMLLSPDGKDCICMNAKLLKWFALPVKPLKDMFLHSRHYYETGAAQCFTETFRLLIPYYQRDAYEHSGCLRQLDGFSVLRRLLGLYHLLYERRYSRETATKEAYAAAAVQKMQLCSVRQLTYREVYWHPKCISCCGSYGAKLAGARQQMEQEAALLRELSEPVAALFFDTLGITLQIELSDMWELAAQLALSKEKERWLRRYAL